MVEMACFKAKKRKSFYSEKHSRIFSAVLRYEELYLDELAELLEMPQKEINEVLSDLISRKLIKKNDFKYSIIEPFESANNFLFGKK